MYTQKGRRPYLYEVITFEGSKFSQIWATLKTQKVSKVPKDSKSIMCFNNHNYWHKLLNGRAPNQLQRDKGKFSS